MFEFGSNDVQVHAGGHVIDFEPVSSKSIKVTVNGANFNMARPFKSGREEIFRYTICTQRLNYSCGVEVPFIPLPLLFL